MQSNEYRKSNLERFNKAKKIVINKTKRDANKVSTNWVFAELVIAQETVNIALRRITKLTNVIAKQVKTNDVNVVAKEKKEQWDNRI